MGLVTSVLKKSWFLGPDLGSLSIGLALLIGLGLVERLILEAFVLVED